MSETPETTSGPTSAAATQQQKPYWLYRFAAWVVIVAGIVFVASTVFFAGAYASEGGWHGHHRCHHHGHGMWHKGHHHHGPGPATPGEDDNGPGEVPSSVAPSVAPPGR